MQLLKIFDVIGAYDMGYLDVALEIPLEWRDACFAAACDESKRVLSSSRLHQDIEEHLRYLGDDGSTTVQCPRMSFQPLRSENARLFPVDFLDVNSMLVVDVELLWQP